MQITMSTETEKKLQTLLAESKGKLSSCEANGTSSQTGESSSKSISKVDNNSNNDAIMERFSLELRDRQNIKKVNFRCYCIKISFKLINYII